MIKIVFSKIFIFLVVFLAVIPFFSYAQEDNGDDIFRAKIIDVLDEQETEIDGKKVKQQVLKIVGLEGEYKDEEIIINNISGVYTIKNKVYQEGNKILIASTKSRDGKIDFYVVDNVRTNALFWLFGIFVFVVVAIGKWKGLRSLFALFLSFLIIIKYIIPSILSGVNPVIPTLIGSFLILLLIIYLTEGINAKSHIAVVSILFSLILVVVIANIFIKLSFLTGLSNEESFSLVALGNNMINFRGLLLAGIIIGSLGVLDDVVVSQVTAVEKLVELNPVEERKMIFKKAYEIGISHVSSMTNTLFLAYTGVSMSILILFVSGGSAFSTWTQVINNEAISTEIVRTLAGSIGLILAIPLSTLLSVWWFKR